MRMDTQDNLDRRQRNRCELATDGLGTKTFYISWLEPGALRVHIRVPGYLLVGLASWWLRHLPCTAVGLFKGRKEVRTTGLR